MLLKVLSETASEVHDRNWQAKIQELLPKISDLAKQFFSRNDITVEPADSATGPDILVRLNGGHSLNQQSSHTFQRYLNRKLQFNFGLLNTIVLD